MDDNRLMSIAEIRKIVFGSPSLQLGDITISLPEVSKAISENDEIRRKLKEKQYRKVLNDAKHARADYANYGCYGYRKDAIFYAIEIYKFETLNKNDDYLFIIIAKPFTCEFFKNETDIEKYWPELTADDVLVDYLGQVESDYFFGSYNDYIGKRKINVNEKEIDLILDIPINTSPEDFYVMYLERFN